MPHHNSININKGFIFASIPLALVLRCKKKNTAAKPVADWMKKETWPLLPKGNAQLIDSQYIALVRTTGKVNQRTIFEKPKIEVNENGLGPIKRP